MPDEKPLLTPGGGKSSYTFHLVSESRAPRLPERPGIVMVARKFPFETYKHLLSGKPYIRPPRRQPPADDSAAGA